MKLTITSAAEKQIGKLSKALQIIIFNKIRNLVQNTVVGEEKLSGYKGFYRTRAGNYRVVYKKFADEIEIVLVAHRKEVYKKLERYLN